MFQSLSSSSPTLLSWFHTVLIQWLISNSSTLQRLLLSYSLWSSGTNEHIVQKSENHLCGPAEPHWGS